MPATRSSGLTASRGRRTLAGMKLRLLPTLKRRHWVPGVVFILVLGGAAPAYANIQFGREQINGQCCSGQSLDGIKGQVSPAFLIPANSQCSIAALLGSFAPSNPSNFRQEEAGALQCNNQELDGNAACGGNGDSIAFAERLVGTNSGFCVNLGGIVISPGFSLTIAVRRTSTSNWCAFYNGVNSQCQMGFGDNSPPNILGTSAMGEEAGNASCDPGHWTIGATFGSMQNYNRSLGFQPILGNFSSFSVDDAGNHISCTTVGNFSNQVFSVNHSDGQ